MTMFLNHLTVQDIGLQRWRRVRCALGCIVCNKDSEHLGKLVGVKTHQLEEGGVHQVETEVDGCGAHWSSGART